MELSRDDPQVQAFMAKLDQECGPGYAQMMFDDDPILFEAMYRMGFGEQQRDVILRNEQIPEPQEEDSPSDFENDDVVVQNTRTWLKRNAPRLRDTTLAELAAEADRDYLKLFENCGLAHRTLKEICQQAETLAAMAQTGDLNPDQDSHRIRPNTIIALSHDADGEGIESGPGYYSSFRRAVEGELIVYLAAELGPGRRPSSRDLRRYKRICQRLYAALLLHRRNRDTSKACALVRRALDGFTGSRWEVFHPLQDSIRHDGYPLKDPEEFHETFGIPVQEADVRSPKQWRWIVDHLELPYV